MAHGTHLHHGFDDKVAHQAEHGPRHNAQLAARQYAHVDLYFRNQLLRRAVRALILRRPACALSRAAIAAAAVICSCCCCSCAPLYVDGVKIGAVAAAAAAAAASTLLRRCRCCFLPLLLLLLYMLVLPLTAALVP